MTEIITVQSPCFDAGVVVDKGNVRFTAPIVDYMRFWTKDQVLDYCAKKHWRTEVIELVEAPLQHARQP